MSLDIWHSVWMSIYLCSHLVSGQPYSSVVAIMKELVENGDYHTEVRPLKNQSHIMYAYVEFQLVSIVGIDDVAQSFTANGFLVFYWTDEILQWDPDKYNGQTTIHPVPGKLWRPRVILMNTLGDRDLFKDDDAPMFVSHKGETAWMPGSLFPSSCELHLVNYPFDEQTCTISFVSMTFTHLELLFVAGSPKVKQDFFVKHGEWELTDSSVTTSLIGSGTLAASTVQLTFVLQRRPTFLMMNIILPVVFLSFLNILVFVIPADSGEKISYGITVLLALSVFLSIVSSMLPRTGTSIPKLTIYLFILLIISMLTVIVSIIIVCLTHKDETETKNQRVKENSKNGFTRNQKFSRITSSIKQNKVGDNFTKSRVEMVSLPDTLKIYSLSSDEVMDYETNTKHQMTSPEVNKHRLIGKHVDLVSFVIFLVLWIMVTFGFLLDMAV